MTIFTELCIGMSSKTFFGAKIRPWTCVGCGLHQHKNKWGEPIFNCHGCGQPAVWLNEGMSNSQADIYGVPRKYGQPGKSSRSKKVKEKLGETPKSKSKGKKGRPAAATPKPPAKGRGRGRGQPTVPEKSVSVGGVESMLTQSEAVKKFVGPWK